MNFTKITRNQYKELLDKTLFKTFFHYSEFHEFLEKQFRWIAFEYYKYGPASPDASQGGNGTIFPLARFKVFNKEKIVSLPFCEYGGPLILKGEIDLQEFEKDVFQEFGEDTRGGVDSLKIKFHPQTLSYEVEPRKDVRGLTSDIFTHWIENLKNTTEQELWNSFRKTLRHEISHAQENNLIIKKYSASSADRENPKELKRFYSLYIANLTRKKTVPYPWQIVRFLCQNPSNELLLAFHGDKIIGGSLFLEYDGFVHYFLSASDYKYKNLGANYLILWEKIKSLINQDVILDLGATPKNSSLYTFKSGWGGKEYPIIVLENKKNIEKLRSSRLRNLFALLPNFAVKILSKHLIKYRL